MSTLKFVLGPATVDHQTELVNQLHTQLLEHPHDQFFFLVPNHIKFSTEIEILQQLRSYKETPVYAQSQVQILSFSRLAWFLLRDKSEYQIPRISQVGSTMLVAKIVQDLPEKELKMFAREAHRYGFIQELTDQILELENANILPSDYQSIIDKLQKNNHKISTAFLDKLAVLFKVYAKYYAGMADRLNNTEIYSLLRNQLNRGDFSHTHFFLNRYNGEFSATEEKVVEAMIKNANSTTMGLVLDHPYRDTRLPEQDNLFFQTGMQYHRLAKFVQSQDNIQLLPDNYAKHERVNNDDLIKVGKWFQAQAKYETIMPTNSSTATVHFFSAPNRVAELERITTQIRQMVSSGKYRYRDFLVITRRLDGYSTMLKPIFNANEIPVFNDNDRSMANHPLVTLIDGLFKIAKNYFQLPDVLQLLKTGLVEPFQDEKRPVNSDFMSAIYTTENWCLKYGKTGKAWLDSRKWQFTPNIDPKVLADNPELQKREEQQTGQINWVKKVVQKQIAPIVQQLKEASNGKQAALILYQGLEQLGVSKQLEDWVTQATKQGKLELAQQPQQVWQTLIKMLDEYVTVLGGSGSFSLEEFQEIIQVGFETATYSQIPSTMDQVLVSETGIVQTNQRKVVFVMGATADVMPEMKINDGLLSDPDKEILATGLNDHQYLPISGEHQAENELFMNYLGALSGTEQLYMSAPLIGNDEEHLMMSPYMTGLASFFGKWDQDNQQLTDDLPFAPTPRADFHSLRPFVGAAKASLTNYVQVARIAKNNGETLSAGWRALARELNHEKLGWLKSSLNYQNDTTKLNPELASMLYGHLDPAVLQEQAAAHQKGEVFDWSTISKDRHHNTLATSISQLQTFYKNPYEFFLKFGLGLRKREELEISNANSGTFYHDTLEELLRLIQQAGMKLQDVQDDQLAVFVAKAMDWAFGRQPSVVELADNYQRINYQKRHLEMVVLTMARVLRNQAQYSAAHTITTEQQFGRVGQLNDRHDTQPSYRALIYQTKVRNRKSNQSDLTRKVYLRGRIDRVDAVTNKDSVDNQDYLTVIDYKSADKQFDLVDAFEGLDLQMLTYLNNLQANLDIANPGRSTKIAGALYLHLFSPYYHYEDLLKNSPKMNELKRHQYKGILIDNDDVLRQLDKGLLTNHPDPMLLNVRYTKSKDLISAKRGSLLVNDDQLQQLLAKNKELIINATEQIFSGNVDLKPFRRDQRTGLDYSDYLDIYHFDNLLDQNKYREINLDDQDVLKLLKQEKKE